MLFKKKKNTIKKKATMYFRNPPPKQQIKLKGPEKINPRKSKNRKLS